MLDTGAPWYDVYETSDGKWLALGSIEQRFYQALLKGLELADAQLPKQHDRKGWPELRARFGAVIKSKTRDAWTEVFSGTDACVTPVLSLDEVNRDPHMAARGTLQTVDGVTAPAPAPRFSRSKPEAGAPAREPGADTQAVLADFGFSAAEIKDLGAKGVVGMPS